MSFEPVGALLDIGGKLIERIFPDPVKREEGKLRLFELQQNGQLQELAADTDLMKAQLAINQVEAGSDSRFKSWWRPALGWVCVLAFALEFLVFPITSAVLILAGKNVALPKLD